MIESEFNRLADAALARIETAIDDCGGDVECNRSGNVLEIEFDSGEKVVVNRHVPNQELWIAAKSGGFHFALRDGQWLAARDGKEFGATLSAVVSHAAGCDFVFAV